VKDAIAAVGAFLAERHLAVDAVEGDAEAHEVGDTVGGFARKDARGLGIDETGAGVECVCEVQIGAVVGADGGGNATLGVLRVALVDAALGENEDAAVLARHKRRVEPGDA
jgi:hypothetical protein